MDPSSLRVEFEKQIKDAEVKIAKAEEQKIKNIKQNLFLVGNFRTSNPKSETQDILPDTTPALDE